MPLLSPNPRQRERRVGMRVRRNIHVNRHFCGLKGEGRELALARRSINRRRTAKKIIKVLRCCKQEGPGCGGHGDEMAKQLPVWVWRHLGAAGGDN